jgi:DNA-binding NarL/FixJ family response regulator
MVAQRLAGELDEEVYVAGPLGGSEPSQWARPPHRSNPYRSDAEVSPQLLEDRIAELEARLRRIAAELRAAGIVGDLDTFPSLDDHPQMAELTSRQREILIRLLDAQRVSVIATELFVSPSTVRNHLMTIFTKFGVHSQAELLAVLRTYR